MVSCIGLSPPVAHHPSTPLPITHNCPSILHQFWSLGLLYILMHKPDTRTQHSTNEMLSYAPAPIFGAHWDTRPSVSSPLSSSPIRASSPLSPLDKNTLFQRQTQSSPIQPLKSRFASRQTRPNPVVRKREDAQESRRANFLQNVRRKAEDKAWQRRDIEGHVCRIDHHNPMACTDNPASS